MKKFLLVLLVVLWPTTVKAALIFYNVSFTILAENLFDPRYGDLPFVVEFAQDLAGDPLHGALQFSLERT